MTSWHNFNVFRITVPLLGDIWVGDGFPFTAQFYSQIVHKRYYRKTSNISRTLVSNKIVDNSDVVGASPVGAAPTTSSFST